MLAKSELPLYLDHMSEEVKSRYQKIELPEFESKIPPHLVNKMSDQEKWLVEAISKLDQKTDWLLQKMVETGGAVLDIDIRTAKIEDWKTIFSGKWALIGAVGFMVLTAVASAGARALFEHFATKHI